MRLHTHTLDTRAHNAHTHMLTHMHACIRFFIQLPCGWHASLVRGWAPHCFCCSLPCVRAAGCTPRQPLCTSCPRTVSCPHHRTPLTYSSSRARTGQAPSWVTLPLQVWGVGWACSPAWQPCMPPAGAGAPVCEEARAAQVGQAGTLHACRMSAYGRVGGWMGVQRKSVVCTRTCECVRMGMRVGAC